MHYVLCSTGIHPDLLQLLLYIAKDISFKSVKMVVSKSWNWQQLSTDEQEFNTGSSSSQKPNRAKVCMCTLKQDMFCMAVSISFASLHALILYVFMPLHFDLSFKAMVTGQEWLACENTVNSHLPLLIRVSLSLPLPIPVFLFGGGGGGGGGGRGRSAVIMIKCTVLWCLFICVCVTQLPVPKTKFS